MVLGLHPSTGSSALTLFRIRVILWVVAIHFKVLYAKYFTLEFFPRWYYKYSLSGLHSIEPSRHTADKLACYKINRSLLCNNESFCNNLLLFYYFLDRSFFMYHHL